MRNRPTCTYSETLMATCQMIQEVQQDRHGLQVLQQQRARILDRVCRFESLLPREQSLPDSVKAMALEYYRHYVRVKSVAEEELKKEDGEHKKHTEVMQRLTT